MPEYFTATKGWVMDFGSYKRLRQYKELGSEGCPVANPCLRSFCCCCFFIFFILISRSFCCSVSPSTWELPIHLVAVTTDKAFFLL